METKEYITGDMLIGEIISRYPIAVRALMECGMHCVTCPSARNETLEEAAMVHGLPAEEVRNYVNERVAIVETMMGEA